MYKIIEDTQADFQAGTLTNVVATADGNLQLPYNSGKLLYDNFDDGNYDGWTSIEGGTPSVLNGKLRLTRDSSRGCTMVFPLSVTNNGVLIQARVTLRSGDTSAAYIGFGDGTQSNMYRLAVHCAWLEPVIGMVYTQSSGRCVVKLGYYTGVRRYKRTFLDNGMVWIDNSFL